MLSNLWCGYHTRMTHETICMYFSALKFSRPVLKMTSIILLTFFGAVF